MKGGYFIIQNEHDLEVATRHLKPRAVAIFRRLRALERVAAREFGHLSPEIGRVAESRRIPIRAPPRPPIKESEVLTWEDLLPTKPARL